MVWEKNKRKNSELLIKRRINGNTPQNYFPFGKLEITHPSTTTCKCIEGKIKPPPPLGPYVIYEQCLIHSKNIALFSQKMLHATKALESASTSRYQRSIENTD